MQTLTVTGTGRYVRDERHGPGHRLRLLAVGVPGLRHDRQHRGLRHRPTRPRAGRPPRPRPRTPASRPRPRSTATPAPAGRAPSPIRSGSRWTSASRSASARWCCTGRPPTRTAFQIQRRPQRRRTWTTIYSTTTGTGGTPDAHRHRHRPVRAAQRHRAGHAVRLLAVRVPGRTGTGPIAAADVGDDHDHAPRLTHHAPPRPRPRATVLLSYNKPAVASTSFQNDGATATPARRPRRSTTTRPPAGRPAPTTGWVDPGWIYVDLGATATISRVVLQWDPAYATAYQIQVSANASTWTHDLHDHHGPRLQGDPERVNGTGRYVRMYGTARSNAVRLLAVGVPGLRHRRRARSRRRRCRRT